ncbi:helix-turn-helix domain-containing protein [Streptomyces sp. NPDC059788]|uniref:helix-turn-helix domain-containing protein n=1 Tax=Streptomyces sp. NPDC059788 TaxID=3346948 RepID=UPI003650096C
MIQRAECTLADKINHLFSVVRAEDGSEYRNEHVAAAIRETGVRISQSYIWQLRRSGNANPTLRHLQALADFFGVPAAYFLDDAVARRVGQELAALAAERARLREEAGSGDVRLMALRAGELSSEGRRRVLELLDLVHRMERAERETRQECGTSQERGRPDGGR